MTMVNELFIICINAKVIFLIFFLLKKQLFIEQNINIELKKKV